MKKATLKSNRSVLFVIILQFNELVAASETIAKNKDVTMSSTFKTWEGFYAVDGNRDTSADMCLCCAATTMEDDPWLTIDLGDNKLFTRIVLYGRTDLQYPSQNLFGLAVNLDNSDSAIVSINTTSSSYIDYYEFHLGKPYSGRYITFVLPRNDSLLVLCEIDVFHDRIVSYKKTASTSSTFIGLGDSWVASRAVDGNPNTQPLLCLCCSATLYQTDPWLRVDFEREFRVTRVVIIGRTDSEYRGQNFVGAVIQLDEYQIGTVTSTEWVNFWSVDTNPGRSASSITVTLAGGDKQLVVCELLAYADCIAGTFGQTCDKECHCEGATCLTNTGKCPSEICKPGYIGNTCSERCMDGHFGQGCTEQCHCEGDPCPFDTGICLSGICKPGYEGNTCSKGCMDGYFGPGCTKQCHCEGDNCPGDTGICPSGICKPGYEGNTCSKSCDDGYYGNCETRCGNCRGPDTCNKTTGECHRGCELGYHRPLCTIDCEAGRFGFNCDHICGMCKDGDVCDTYTGVCPKGCVTGYKGSQCTEEENNQANQSGSDTSVSGPVIIGSLVAGIVLVAAIGFGLAIMFYRKMKSKGTQNETSRVEEPTALSNISSNYDTLKFE